MNKKHLKRIPLTISAANTAVPFSIVTEKGYPRVTGIAVFVSDTAALPKSVFSSPLLCGSVEVFPTDFQPKVLFCGNEVPADDRFYDLTQLSEFQGDGKSITGAWKDERGSITAYTVDIYIRSEV